MANYHNINRSIEAHEIRMIDTDDGQLKKLTDIPSLGGGGGGGDGYTDAQIDAILANKADTTYVNNNFYTETETNALLNNKADLTNGAQSITASQITTALDSTTDIVSKHKAQIG